MAMYLHVNRLPSEYQEVEYIEGTGTAYLIIGNYINTSYIMETKYQLTDSLATIVLGCNRGSRTPYRRYGLISESGITNVIAGGSSWTNLGTPGTAVHTIKIQGSTAYWDGVATSISYSANLGIDYGLGVFIYNNPSLPSANAGGRVFYLKISDSDSTPLYDLVPCYRKADGEIGMYDLVTNTFFTNQGTGTFIKGNDVDVYQEKEVKNAYIGEYVAPVTYTLLSTGGSINKFSELSLHGSYIGLRDRTTYWNGYVGTVDKYGFHYKIFDKKILGFRINMITQSPSGEFPGLRFWIFKDSSGFGSGDRPGISNCIYGNANSQVYEGSETGTFSFGYDVNGTGQKLVNQNKTHSVSDLTYVGQLSNGVWNISITSTDGESWSGTYTPDSSIQDLYGIALRGERRYTGNTGEFVSVEVTLAE